MVLYNSDYISLVHIDFFASATNTNTFRLISHIEDTPDYLIPYLWSLPLEQNKFARYQQMKALQSRPGLRDRSECCTIM